MRGFVERDKIGGYGITACRNGNCSEKIYTLGRLWGSSRAPHIQHDINIQTTMDSSGGNPNSSGGDSNIINSSLDLSPGTVLLQG